MPSSLLHLQLFSLKWFCHVSQGAICRSACNVCAKQERVAASCFCQLSQVTVLYYQSVFIAVSTFTALPGRRNLQKMLGFAPCIRPLQFAKPCHSMDKGRFTTSPLGITGYTRLSCKQVSLALVANRVWTVRAAQGSMPHICELSPISQQPLKLKASSGFNLATMKRALSHGLRKFPTHEEPPSPRIQADWLKQEQGTYPSRATAVKPCLLVKLLTS